MKIFILPTSFPNRFNPIADIFIKEQVKALCNCGHEVVVLNVIKHPSKDILRKISKKIERISEDGYIRYSVEIKTFCENKFLSINGKHFRRAMMRLFKYVKEKEGIPDVLYAHFSLYAGLAGVDIKKKHGIPLMTLEHGGLLMKERIKNNQKKELRAVVSNSNCYAVVSNGLKKAIIKHLNISEKSIIVIPNMISDEFSLRQRKEKDIFTFLGVANLNKGKRFDLLIDCFCETFSSEDKVELVIAGEGPERKLLEQKILEKSRQGQIVLKGRVTRDQTVDLYASCDCFVLLSASETFGLVYREAMATGRPIITTNHGGFSQDEWNDSFGIMVPVDNKEESKKAIRYVFENIDKYDADMISEQCIKRHAATNIVALIEQNLKEIKG